MNNIITDCQRTPLLSQDLNAEYYTQCSHLQHTLAGDILSRIDNLADKTRAYDIGCGDGSITAELARQMPKGKITGIDVSPSMIEYATRTFCTSNQSKNIDFQLQNAENFSPRGRRPDLVTSFSAFHWVRKPEEALRKLCKSIIPGGDLVILTYVHSNYYQFLQNTLMKHYPECQQQSAYYTMFSAEGYRRVLEDCGMEITEFKTENLIATEESERAVKDFIEGWLASFVPLLPQEEHERFLDLAMTESLPYRLASSDGKIHLPYTELVIRAKKGDSFESCCEAKCTIS